jgi:hypothetical protein
MKALHQKKTFTSAAIHAAINGIADQLIAALDPSTGSG